MCDHHLFIIIVPNDWRITDNYEDYESNRLEVNIFLFEDE
jgi:hypothetical protein